MIKSGKSTPVKGKGQAKKGAASSTLPTARTLAVHVKNAHKRKPSSNRWLERHLNDPYVAESKRQGWRSRAAFKLLQIDERFHILKPGQRVVDLGAAPGGWTQVAVQIVKPENGKGVVVGLDVLEMEPVTGAITFVADITHDDSAERLKKELGGPADVVLSDMAAPTTGHQQTDHLRVVALAEIAVLFAIDVLKPGGSYVCKLFQGGAAKELNALLKKHFASVKNCKPAASRAESSETYIVATGFRKVD